MGDEATSTRRLNFAQSFNPMGSLLGMTVASNYVLTSLDSEKRDAAGNLIFHSLGEAEKAVIRTHDLEIIRNPYVIIGGVVLLVFVIIALTKMPRTQSAEAKNIRAIDSARRLLRNHNYREGVPLYSSISGKNPVLDIISQYAENIGIPKAVGQRWNILAMSLFLRPLYQHLPVEVPQDTLMLTLFCRGGHGTPWGISSSAG